MRSSGGDLAKVGLENARAKSPGTRRTSRGVAVFALDRIVAELHSLQPVAKPSG